MKRLFRLPCRPSPTRARQVSKLHVATLLLALFISASVCAAPPRAAAEAKRGQLKELQGRIESLQRDLAKSEETKASAADQLKETESAISAASRGLHELARQRAEVQVALSDLQQQSQRLGSQIAKQQRQLGRLLYRQYVNGEAEALQMILAGGDPNQAARDLHYLTLLSHAKADLLYVLRSTLAEKVKLTEAASIKRDELAAIEQQQQQQRAALLSQQRRHQGILAKLADRIKAQRREIGALKQDEKRLGKLIEGLSRIVAKAARIPRSVRAKPEASHKTTVDQEPTAEDLNFSGNFGKLKGSLRLPVIGQLANRFGQPRAETGATWKGLFIRAAEGSEVKAIAPGRVVFADWLRGFGNLLILDHGDTFLTVYGNNQALFRQLGDTVKAGEVIATIGNSGGNPESGLYFELRQQGRAVDPLKWANFK